MTYSAVRTIQKSVWWLVMIAAAILASQGCATVPAGKTLSVSPAISRSVQEALVQFNRGAALLEQYKYVEAAEAFETVLKAAPEWMAARFNLGLACLNMQEEADAQESLTRAKDAFESVLRENPGHLSARFCLGLYNQHVGENAKALECFRIVHQADPGDPYVAYKYAEVLIGLDRKEAAAETLERLVKLDPGFVSAIYRLAMMYQQGGRREEARALFARFRELQHTELTGGTFAVLSAYGTVGKYCMALKADDFPLGSPEVPGQRVLFAPQLQRLPERSSVWKAGQVGVNLPGVAAGDVDGDGDLDLCLCALDADGATAIWHNDGAGAFSKGQVLAQGGICPSFGDVDNDGDIDLWLGCAGPDIYFANDGAGQFEPTPLDGMAPGDIVTHSARLVDMDSDGDLDFMAFHLMKGSVPADQPCQGAAGNLYNNNRDGSFADVAEKSGLAFGASAVAAAVCDDFDNDRDLNLVVFPQGSPPVGWVNDRVWQYRFQDAGSMGLAGIEGVLGATTGDPDGRR